ncbi:hypothetical protein AVEN_87971-1 [Araneus ventricosus]|uniref:Uncharacterized protein n=1 Tax=Araneus ventricosus TaxID=182803 RepID=A0A4Y2I5D5_ARAVE|nr:hypothetical protein AVEN_87971-1 [Araneus ventricosus]
MVRILERPAQFILDIYSDSEMIGSSPAAVLILLKTYSKPYRQLGTGLATVMFLPKMNGWVTDHQCLTDSGGSHREGKNLKRWNARYERFEDPRFALTRMFWRGGGFAGAKAFAILHDAALFPLFRYWQDKGSGDSPYLGFQNDYQ